MKRFSAILIFLLSTLIVNAQVISGAEKVKVSKGDTIFQVALSGLTPGVFPSGTSGQTLRHNGSAWVANSVLFNNGTNVGIGTVSPTAARLVVESTTKQAQLNYSATKWMGITVGSTASTTFTPSDNTTSAFNFTNAAGTSILNVNAVSGFVGIGTTGPGYKLEVNGAIASMVGNGNNAYVQIGEDDNNKVFGAWYGASNYGLIQTVSGGVYVGNLALQANGGNVGIANTNPTGALLTLGTAGTKAGTLSLAGGTSGVVTIQTAAAAGTWTMTVPTSAGSAGQVLTTNGAGVTSWSSNIPGNAATVTTNANLSGAISSVGNTTSLSSFTSANLAGALTDETGTGVAVFGTAPTFTTSITFPVGYVIGGGAHGVTDRLATNIGGAVYFDSYAKGLRLLGISDLADGNGMTLEGIVGHTTPTVSAMSFISSKKSGTGQAALAATEIAFIFTNYLTRLATVLGNGNLGLGTATPTAAKLVVSNNGNYYAQRWENTDEAGAILDLLVQTTSGTSGVYLGTANSAKFHLMTKGAAALTVDTLGKIGIGTTTPENELSFNGDTYRSISVNRPTTANLSGNDLAIYAGSASTGATNKDGGNLNLYPGNSTGTGGSNTIIYASYPYNISPTTNNDWYSVATFRSDLLLQLNQYNGTFGLDSTASHNTVIDANGIIKRDSRTGAYAQFIGSSNITITTGGTYQVYTAGTADTLKNFTFSSGRLIYTGNRTIQVLLTVGGAIKPATGSQWLKFKATKNGSDITQTERSELYATSTTKESLSAVAVIKLNTNDYIETKWTTTDDSVQIVLSQFVLAITEIGN